MLKFLTMGSNVTESTGGSTTGDDEESSDAAVAMASACAETRKNTIEVYTIAVKNGGNFF
jgi:hypothetical protein